MRPRAFHRILFLSGLSIPLSVLAVLSFAAFSFGTFGVRLDKTQRGLLVSSVYGTDGPLRTGDLIVSISGIRYHRVLSSLFMATPRERVRRVTVQRTGNTVVLALRPVFLSPGRYLEIVWPHLLLIAVFMSLGSMALFRAPPGPVARLFFLMLCGLSTSIAATTQSHAGLLQPHVVSFSFLTLAIANWFSFGAFAHFVARFPAQRDLLRRRRWPLFLFYGVPVLVAAGGSWYQAGLAPAFWGWLQRLRNICVPLFILGVYAKHVTDYRRLDSLFLRNQLKLLIAAYWFSFGPYLVLYLLPNLLLDHPLISFRVVLFTFMVLPASYMVALLRYRLLGVDALISRAAAYVVLTGGLMMLYAGLLVLLKRRFWQGQVFSEPIFLLFLLAIAVGFAPMLKRLRKVIDRYFFRTLPEDSVLLMEFSRKLVSALHLDDLVHLLITDLPEHFLVTRAAILVLEGGKSRLYPEQPHIGTRFWGKSRLAVSLREKEEYVFCRTEESDPILMEELGVLDRAGYRLALGLRSSSALTGMLLLGARRDGRLFRNNDLRIFTIIANQAAIALENALHYESLEASKKQMEKLFGKILHSEKMAAIGEMTSTLAHELKTPLGIIRSSGQILAEGGQPASVQREMLHYIVDEVDKLDLVITGILGLARFQEPVFSQVDLKPALTSLVKGWQQNPDHSARVSIDLAVEPNLPPVQADLRQISLVISNLLQNSEDAMQGDGRITLSISRHGEGVEIRVRDTGAGICEKDRRQIFSKFFTTKKNGLGLGLPICRQIIRSHSGRISLENHERGGAVARIILPQNPIEHILVPAG